eukprot:14362-Hanusia_phi.AAC.1
MGGCVAGGMREDVREDVGEDVREDVGEDVREGDGQRSSEGSEREDIRHQNAAKNIIGREEYWLRSHPKTSKDDAPRISLAQCLSAREAHEAKQALIQKESDARAVPYSAPIDEPLICSWDFDTSGIMDKANDHFIIVLDTEFPKRRVLVEFVPFAAIDSSVYGWSYRWATPIDHSELITIEVIHRDSQVLLYRTRIFEMELIMLGSDVKKFGKIWIDKVCVPQKSQYTGYQVSAMGTFYQKATTVLREVRNPKGLPFYDYLARAWTYQEARYGRTICDSDPPLYLAKDWAEMLWGRQFVVNISGLLYQIPNLMARTMDDKVGPNNITFTAMRNCIGSGYFFTFFVKNFRRHEGFTQEMAKNKNLKYLEEIANSVGAEVDQKLLTAFQNLSYEAVDRKGQPTPSVIGPFDCRTHPELTGVLWQEIVKLRSRYVLDVDESCLPEVVAEMSLRRATFESDRFIGTFAVLLKKMEIDLARKEDGFPDPEETWLRLTSSYLDGLMQQPNLAFMLYGPADIAGMSPVHLRLPSGILGTGQSYENTPLECERVVTGIGDGDTDEQRTFPDLRNAWAVHVSDEGAVSLLIRADVASADSPYRRIAVIGKDLAASHRSLAVSFCGLLQLGGQQLLQVEQIARALKVENRQVADGIGAIAGIFREYILALGGGQVPGKGGRYVKQFKSIHSIPPDAPEQEMTPLRELVYMHNKMSKTKVERSWTRFETVNVMVEVQS